MRVKGIAAYFLVTIDELLWGEKLLSLAEKENKSNMQKMCDLLFGMADVCAILLIILPLYPKTVGEYIYSVNLFAYTETTPLNRMIYWGMFAALIVCGTMKLLMAKLEIEKCRRVVTDVSVGLHILAVVFLAMAREPYAVTMAFLLLILKGILLLKNK